MHKNTYTGKQYQLPCHLMSVDKRAKDKRGESFQSLKVMVKPCCHFTTQRLKTSSKCISSSASTSTFSSVKWSELSLAIAQASGAQEGI